MGTPVEQPILAIDFNYRNNVVLRARIDLASLKSRVDERTNADPRNRTRLSSGDIPIQVGYDALREIVRLDVTLQGKAPDLRYEPPMAPDGTLQ